MVQQFKQIHDQSTLDSVARRTYNRFIARTAPQQARGAPRRK
jgi:hypothetical protein